MVLSGGVESGGGLVEVSPPVLWSMGPVEVPPLVSVTVLPEDESEVEPESESGGETAVGST